MHKASIKTRFLLAFLFLTLLSTGFAADNPKELVNLARDKVDPAYRKAVQHHRVIKSYLAASAKERPEFEAVLLFLLLNGYSINDLPTAWFVLNVPLFPQPVESEKLRTNGVSDALIRRRQQQYDLVISSQRGRVVMAGTESGVNLAVFVKNALYCAFESKVHAAVG